MEYSRILTCKTMTTDEIWVRILIYNDCGTEKFLNVFFPVYMCPRGLLGPPAVTLTKKLKYAKRLLLRGIHHFISDLINIMDHMRISGTEPSSVILSQTK